jgi:glycosyltransferase involved in cell wall biosynthesis
MRVSVIIPTYNSAALVVEAVESALAQTDAPLEVIVVDDGSTDDTAERLRPYLSRIIYVRQKNARVAAARNTGLDHATGEVIAFLDADDAWHPAKLRRQLAVLSQRPEIGLLATRLTAWPGQFTPASELAAGRVDDIPLSAMLLSNRLATSSIIVRRSVLDRAGRFDTELFGPEDYDLWLRVARLSQVAMLDEPLTGYRDCAGSLSKQAETMHRGLMRIHAKLDAAAAWPSGWHRRKSRAHVDYSTGYMYLAAGCPTQAAAFLLRSLAGYPWPMGQSEMRYRWARVRLLVRSLREAAAGFAGMRPRIDGRHPAVTGP